MDHSFAIINLDSINIFTTFTGTSNVLLIIHQLIISPVSCAFPHTISWDFENVVLQLAFLSPSFFNVSVKGTVPIKHPVLDSFSWSRFWYHYLSASTPGPLHLLCCSVFLAFSPNQLLLKSHPSASITIASPCFTFSHCRSPLKIILIFLSTHVSWWSVLFMVILPTPPQYKYTV